MNFVDNLSEFYKHCLNICQHKRPNNNEPPLWGGWMRCYITPYLVNGKIIEEIHLHFKEIHGEEFCKFKSLLLYTLQDYIDYISCFEHKKNEDTIKTTKDLIRELEKMENNEIIDIIERNKNKSPSYEDCDNEDMIDENYNEKLTNHLLLQLQDD